MAEIIALVSKLVNFFKSTYEAFVKIMTPDNPKPKKEIFKYILHIRVATVDGEDFFIAKKITPDLAVKVPKISGILDSEIKFKKSDTHTYLASIEVDSNDLPQLLNVLISLGFFLDGTIKAKETAHGK